MLNVILIIIAVIIVVLVIVIALQPAESRVSRSTTISAPPAAVFAHVNDFHMWEAWSPWEKVDPAVKKTYGGSPTGVGATYAWEGNKEVGAGNMKIIESRPGELIRIHMEFLKPMKGLSTTDFTFKQEGDDTIVTQTMYGPKNFVSKAMCLVMNIDNMIGGMFEKGLASLKSVVERS